MKKRFIITILAFLMLTLPFLQGCEHMLDFLPIEIPDVPLPPEPAPVEVVVEEIEEEPPPPPEPPMAGNFSLRFDPNSTLNPILALNRDNIVLSSLVYESLFILDQNLNAVPLLSQNWETEDYQEFVFEIRPNIIMHDGQLLTSEDVIYSFRLAMSRGRFANRLNSVASISAIDETSFSVVLDSPNSRFIYLLDFPIIRSGSLDEDDEVIPPGTGPFTISATRFRPSLNLFGLHRDAENMPVSEILLRSLTDSELTDYFDSGGLSLLWDDPASTFDLRLNRHHETRFFETTALQFIGFNAETLFFRDPDIRRGVSSSIERQLIVDDIMPGQSLAAPLAFSPALSWYNFDWEFSHLTPAQEMSYLFNRAGLEDFQNTSYLDLDTGTGDFIRFTVNFIVNSENTHKVQAAHRIARTLRQAGVDISVSELAWDDFVEALENGDFDMFYGEIMLGADFDLSPLLLPGPLNFGQTASTIYRPLIDDFLAATTQEEIEQAASLLLDEIRINAPFAPILFKRHAIYTPLGAISDAEPNQSSIFHNFNRWTIDLYMLT